VAKGGEGGIGESGEQESGKGSRNWAKAMASQSLSPVERQAYSELVGHAPQHQHGHNETDTNNRLECRVKVDERTPDQQNNVRHHSELPSKAAPHKGECRVAEVKDLLRE
jgi:hypothetical protein